MILTRIVFRFKIILFFICSYSSVVLAVSYPTDDEIPYLPRYCQARLGNHVSAAEVNKWRNLIGRKVWTGIHHYCQQVNIEQRYYRAVDPNKRKILLHELINGLRGQMKEYGSGFVLKYDAYYRIGWAFRELGKTEEAIESFELAIKSKPKYTKSYVTLSEIYQKSGQYEKALESLDRGLSIVPKSKILNKRKSELAKK